MGKTRGGRGIVCVAFALSGGLAASLMAACTGGDDDVSPSGVDASTSDGSTHPFDSGGSSDANGTTHVDASDSSTPADANDGATADDASDAADAFDAFDAYDAGPVGTQTNPAASCAALLAADAGAASGLYWIDPSLNPVPIYEAGVPDSGTPDAGDGGDASVPSTGAFETYCEMTVGGGGWTKVSPANAASAVDRLKGVNARQLLKCADNGSDSIISPPFSLAWEWNGPTFNEIAGTWSVNGADQACSNNPEYANAPCMTWFGVGCGDGPGGNNKLFPGVLDSPSAEFCADEVSAHTNGAFSVCGGNNFRSYSVFVRSE